MSTFIKNFHTQFLIDIYFSDPKRILRLKEGDILFRQDQFNDRLFLVKKGKLRAFAVDDDGNEVELFIATQFMFVGVNSFFSTSKTMTNIQALENTEVAYVGYKDAIELSGGSASLAEQFMPVVVNELLHRQQQTIKFAAEKETALKKLINSEKLASLGQMAAGVAHELNNAIAVVEKNTEWLGRMTAEIIKKHSPGMETYFRTGLETGRTFSNSEIRARKVRYKTLFKLSDDNAENLAQTNIPESVLMELNDRLQAHSPEIASYWEMGATIKDTLSAARHAAYVVKSVKELGVQRSQRDDEIDINETIREALMLLQSNLRRINVDLHFSSLPFVTANAGELIQVWSNIIQNACESMIHAQTDKPHLVISTDTEHESIIVKIRDNGPGISPQIHDKIFQPNITTKIEGLSFGLGLGLTIVQRIIHSYNGRIHADSEPGSTVFTIQIPSGVNNV